MQRTSAQRVTIRRQYRPLLELGRGGMSRVYLAESLGSGVRKLVVLKVLARGLAASPEMRAAFQREAELSARMNHPNVVQVYEVVEYGGAPVMVMEYLDGLALSRVIQGTRGALPLRLHLAILCQMLAGLHHFHELKDLEGNPLNGVHRDVSPQNVLVRHDGVVKVLDFGIAKTSMASEHDTRAGIIKGKVHYMPPEQLLGQGGLDRRVDVFAVGVMLWEAVAGRRLWEGVEEGHVFREVANGRFPKLRDEAPGVSTAIERIVERALAGDRSERYSTAIEMQLDLEQAMADEGGYVHPRELSAFMLQRFGARREYQERLIGTALRNSSSSLSGIMNCSMPDEGVSGTHPIALDFALALDAARLPVDEEPLQLTRPALPAPSSGVRPASSRLRIARVRAGLAVAATLALASAALLWRAPEVGRARLPVETVAPRTPPAAPPRLRPTPSPAAFAPHRAAFSPEPLGPRPIARPSPPSTRSIVTATGSPASATGPRVERLRDEGQAHCAQPFRLSTDGIRVFKPECL